MAEDDKAYTDFRFEFEALGGCPLCGGDQLQHAGRVDWLEMEFWYQQCQCCGLKFMNPRPSAASYRSFYKDYFWQQKIRNLGFRLEGQRWMAGRWRWDDDKRWDADTGKQKKLEKNIEVRIQAILPVLEQHAALGPDACVLEVGCAFGTTLDELHRRHGVQVFGIEPSDEAVEHMQSEQSPVQVLGRYAEDLEQIRNGQRRFSAIVFSHVLENIVDPFQVLRWSRQCLADDGIIYIQTPNLAVFDQMNPYHPYIFSSGSLARMARREGLALIPWSPPGDAMLTVVMKAAGRPRGA